MNKLEYWLRLKVSNVLHKAEVLRSTEVELLGREFTVFGYYGEGAFDLLRNKGYNEFNLDNLKPFIRPDSVCIDVGANYGMITLAMAHLAQQGKVYAFEGSETTYRALDRTIQFSGFRNIRALPWIVGREGASGLWVHDSTWCGSSYFLPNSVDTASSTSIDGLRLPRVDLIKIDVEGAELDVLQGAMETIARCKPTVIMEFNSFCLVHHRNILPRQALDCICKSFSDVRYFRGRIGELCELKDREGFLRHNMLNGLVDDLVCRV